VRPTLPDELLAIGGRAAALREEIESVVDMLAGITPVPRGVGVARSSLEGYDAATLGVLWPAIAGRAGIALDRRGTERLSQFTMNGTNGGRIQLSGGFEALIHRRRLQIRPSGEEARAVAGASLLGDGFRLGRWLFRRSSDRAPAEGRWMAALPVDSVLTVRTWQPGDRMVPAGSTARRRVKGLLRDAGVDGPSRRGWPVVLAGPDIVWVPGVRRALAATEQSGRSSARYISERVDS
jgi:tRNA(Ile)-lysidine synthetase-like protein